MRQTRYAAAACKAPRQRQVKLALAERLVAGGNSRRISALQDTGCNQDLGLPAATRCNHVFGLCNIARIFHDQAAKLDRQSRTSWGGPELRKIDACGITARHYQY